LHPFRIYLDIFDYNIELLYLLFNIFPARQYTFSGWRISKNHIIHQIFKLKRIFKLSSLTSFVLNLWFLLSYILIRFFYECLTRSIMLLSQLFGEIIDLFFFSPESNLPTPLIHFSDYSVFVCRLYILFSTWIAAPLRFIDLFFFMRIMICDNLICLLYYFQIFIYSNILNIVTFWFSNSSIFNTRIHIELSD
jgi:hypothetical protein